MVYTITRERVTWARWDATTLRTRISHPVVFTVAEDGTPIKTCDTRAEAQQYVKDQDG